MNFESYYGEDLPRLKHMEQRILELVEQYPVQETLDGIEPILYCKSRIKKPESMMRKLKSQGYSTDSKAAMEYMHDAVGVRVVCSFVDNVYEVAEWFYGRQDFKIIATKDYIAYPKPNGYRSLHLILQFTDGPEQGLMAELQIRTIAIDFWAALEHQLKYKREIEHEKTIRDELKRCADEIASVDVTMTTLKDILYENKWK